MDDVDNRINNSIVSGIYGNSITSTKNVRKRRTRIPEKPNCPLSLWSIMKNCIGRELSRISMPVNFNEPLSMLQRLTEDYEYSELLDRAAECKDICEQLVYVAAFSVSSYSTTSNRTGKPFNPLLGETYECDRRDDLGWRCISEQVSHHPPIAAMYCEGRSWVSWQEFTMSSKFRGRYLSVQPLGSANAEFPESGNSYTWKKVTTTVNNIIAGKLWMDHHGEVDIIGQRSAQKFKCTLKFIPYSYFSRGPQRCVRGIVTNDKNEVKWVINGTWDHKLEAAPVYSTSGPSDNPIYDTGTYQVIWCRNPPPPDCDKYYNFTTLACQLNEPEDHVAPTDSRLRPDQRLMEVGNWTESNKEKIRLEEKQRAHRRRREAEAEQALSEGRFYPPYEPIWFRREKLNDNDDNIHLYKGTYWEAKQKQDWSKCPDIF